MSDPTRAQPGPPSCRRCRVPMKRGVAVVETRVVSREFLGEPDAEEAATVYHGGSGVLTECWKCPECGWSLAL